LNPTSVIFNHPSINSGKENAAGASLPYHALSRKIFQKKWGIYPEKWIDSGAYDNPPEKSLIENYLFYPYFERDVDDLEGKGYVTAWNFESQWHDPNYKGLE